jgi:hypothetical protein
MKVRENTVTEPLDLDTITERIKNLPEDVDVRTLTTEFEKESLKNATLSIMRSNQNPVDMEEVGLLRRACKLAGELKYEQEDALTLFETLAVLSGRRSVAMLCKAISNMEVRNSAELMVELQSGLPEFIRNHSGIPTSQLIRMIVLYKNAVSGDQLDDLVTETIGAALLEKIQSPYNDMTAEEFSSHMAYVSECMAIWEFAPVPARAAAERVLEVYNSEDIPSRYKENGAEVIVDYVSVIIDMPGASDVVSTIVDYPDAAKNFVKIYDRDLHLRDIHWVSSIYMNILENMDDEEESEEYDENYSANFSDIPKLALFPDSEGQMKYVNEEVFASNGFVAFRVQPSPDEIPTEVSTLLKQRYINLNQDYYFRVHFIPFDESDFVASDNAINILRMGVWGVNHFQKYIEQNEVPGNTVIFGVTNPRMANIATKCGFETIGLSGRELKDAIKNELDTTVSVITTVDELNKRLNEPKFRALGSRLAPKPRDKYK